MFGIDFQSIIIIKDDKQRSYTCELQQHLNTPYNYFDSAGGQSNRLQRYVEKKGDIKNIKNKLLAVQFHKS